MDDDDRLDLPSVRALEVIEFDDASGEADVLDVGAPSGDADGVLDPGDVSGEDVIDDVDANGDGGSVLPIAADDRVPGELAAVGAVMPSNAVEDGMAELMTGDELIDGAATPTGAALPTGTQGSTFAFCVVGLAWPHSLTTCSPQCL